MELYYSQYKSFIGEGQQCCTCAAVFSLQSILPE